MRAGIDFFPLECRQDDKMKLIKAEFGLTGRAIIVDLWARIYAGEGYYCVWDSEVALLFASEEGVGGKVVLEVVNSAIKRGIFDQEKYEKYGILTSRGIQKRYFEAVSRRVSVEAKNEYLCFNVAEKYKNVNISGKNVYRNKKNVYRNEQSKVKESRVKESIVDDGARARTRAREASPPSLEEVAEYIRERGYKVRASRFVSYFSERSWKLNGKDISGKWKERVDAWEANDISDNGGAKESSFDGEEFYKAAVARSYSGGS